MSFLQKSLTPSFRRKPESRIGRNSWIPGRASLARNDDFLLLSRILQEANINSYFNGFLGFVDPSNYFMSNKLWRFF